MTKTLFCLLFVLDLILAGFLGITAFQTHLIPNYLVAVATAMLVLIPLLLFLLQREKNGEKSKSGFRIAAIVILLFFSLAEGAMGYFLHHYNSSVSKMTEVRTQITRVELYVKKDDRAQTIEYAVESKYRIGILEGMDEDAVSHAREQIEKQHGRTMQLRGYRSLADLVKALDEGQIDAVMISSAYLELIESLEGYEGFSQELRSLYTGSVQTEIVSEPFPEPPEEEEAVDLGLREPELWKESFCTYISGIDTFGPVTTRSRSDVNILAIVNTETKTVLLISTPRDYYVPFRFSPANGAMDKLTHAGIYGIEASMRALGDYYELPVHYYLRVNFSGFMDIIDTLGGVDVDSDADFASSGHVFHKGMNHLNGEEALGFVRNRYSFLEGDRARGRHQMAVIKGLVNGLMSSRAITNYAELMDEFADCLQTNASKAMVGDLVQLTLDRSSGDWKVLTYSADGVGTTDYAYSLGCFAYVMVPNEKTVQYARDLVEAVLTGETMTQEELQNNAPRIR